MTTDQEIAERMLATWLYNAHVARLGGTSDQFKTWPEFSAEFQRVLLDAVEPLLGAMYAHNQQLDDRGRLTRES